MFETESRQTGLKGKSFKLSDTDLKSTSKANKIYWVKKGDMKNKPLTTGQKITDFLFNLHPDFELPEGVSMMHPFHKDNIRQISTQFYSKFYNDTRSRILLLAINPGRLGAGMTGIPFTDPVRLEEKCGISNKLYKKKELSGGFIYEMIEAYGGVAKFYHHFMLSSLCPLGFIKEGKNLNYYDQKSLKEAATPFIVESTLEQKERTGNQAICICLGMGKNYTFLKKLNEKHHFFSKIFPLPHPRYILQYKRKYKESYIKMYLATLKKCTVTVN